MWLVGMVYLLQDSGGARSGSRQTLAQLRLARAGSELCF
eukprot:SAG11_NODE_1319_length_5209_cov_10.314873_4_plen_39_part_00